MEHEIDLSKWRFSHPILRSKFQFFSKKRINHSNLMQKVDKALVNELFQRRFARAFETNLEWNSEYPNRIGSTKQFTEKWAYLEVERLQLPKIIVFCRVRNSLRDAPLFRRLQTSFPRIDIRSWVRSKILLRFQFGTTAQLGLRQQAIYPISMAFSFS